MTNKRRYRFAHRQHQSTTNLRYRDLEYDHELPTEEMVTLPDLTKMKTSELQKELESYGISTKSFLEKKDFVQALEKAHAESKKPVESKEPDENPDKDRTFADSSFTSGTRQERYQKAFEYAKGMKVKNLKEALKDRGISTKSFFEKSEFEKAYAGAMADNTQKKHTTRSTKAKTEDEPFDPSYRDVVTQKLDPRSLVGHAVIDV